MLAGRKDHWQKDPRAGVLVVVAGAGLAGFLALATAIWLAPSFVSFDMTASAVVRSIDLPWLEPVAIAVTHVGDFWSMGALTVLAGLFLYARGHRTSAFTLMLAVASGSAFGAVMKLAFTRVRPALEVARIPIPDSYCFPSGHALGAVLFFGSLVILIMLNEKQLKAALLQSSLCILAAAAIGMSRVYLGVHYLGDIIGSWLLGIAWLALVVIVSARWGASSQTELVTEPVAAEA